MANTVDTVAPELILRGIIDGSITELEDDQVTAVSQPRLRNLPNINRLALKSITSIPNATSWAESTGSSTATMYFPKVESASSALVYGFRYSRNAIALPGLTGVTGELFTNTYMYTIDLGPGKTSLPARTFWGYYNANHNYVRRVILRSPTVVTAAGQASFGWNAGVFTGKNTACYGTTFYVPQALLSSYPTASNWSWAVTNMAITFAAIEGSEYEHYYADGTPIPES